MNGGEMIIAVMLVSTLAIDFARHGEEKKPSKYNFPISLVPVLITYHIYRYAGLFK